MGGRTFQVVACFLTGALALVVLAGPATVALADGGPDRMGGPVQRTVKPRPGFGDRIPAPRLGFGDRIHPAPVVLPAAPAPRAAAEPTERSEGGWGAGLIVTVLGVALVIVALLLIARRQRRVAPA